MSEKQWSILFIKIFSGVLILIGLIVVVVDPFFHYHAPLKGMSYSLENEFYINDGVSKNFKYNAMITGTSMTRGFKTEEAGEIFQKDFIRITYLGEGFKKINDNLTSAIEANPELELVIRSVDPEWFIADENWMEYSEYPDYLTDNNIWNDVNYLYNKEILAEEVLPQIVRTIKGEEADKFDNYDINNTDALPGKETVLAEYQRPEKNIKIIDQAETDYYFEMLERNIDKNIISVMNNNPDVTFYLFFAPYSICWWDGLNQNGTAVLERRIALEQRVIEKVLECENAKLFSFFNNYDLICDFNNYIDDIHYTEEVNSQILKWMKNGEYELTKENYLEYIDNITDFYSNYDYDSVFE